MASYAVKRHRVTGAIRIVGCTRESFASEAAAAEARQLRFIAQGCPAAQLPKLGTCAPCGGAWHIETDRKLYVRPLGEAVRRREGAERARRARNRTA